MVNIERQQREDVMLAVIVCIIALLPCLIGLLTGIVVALHRIARTGDRAIALAFDGYAAATRAASVSAVGAPRVAGPP